MGFLDLFRVGKIKKENEALKQKLQLLHADEYFQISERLDKMNQEISDNNSILFKQREEISSLSAQQQKLDKQVTTQANKLSRYKELYRSVEYALDTFLSSNIPYNNCRLNPHDKSDFDCLAPSVILQLHSMDVKELRKAYNRWLLNGPQVRSKAQLLPELLNSEKHLKIIFPRGKIFFLPAQSEITGEFSEITFHPL